MKSVILVKLRVLPRTLGVVYAVRAASLEITSKAWESVLVQPRGAGVAGGLGSPHVRQHSGLLLLRPQSHRVEGGERLLGQDVRVHGTRVVGSVGLGGGVAAPRGAAVADVCVCVWGGGQSTLSAGAPTTSA